MATLLCVALLLRVDCLTENILVGNQHNLFAQSSGARAEIKLIFSKINKMSIQNIENRLSGLTRDGLGLHAMKVGTLLEGLATADLYLDQNNRVSGPGRARLLFYIRENKRHIFEFVGVVDTHTEVNVKRWEEIDRNERHLFFEVKNKHRESIGVRKVSSNGNTNNFIG